jgi:hypothetical protein
MAPLPARRRRPRPRRKRRQRQLLPSRSSAPPAREAAPGGHGLCGQARSRAPGCRCASSPSAAVLALLAVAGWLHHARASVPERSYPVRGAGRGRFDRPARGLQEQARPRCGPARRVPPTDAGRSR